MSIIDTLITDRTQADYTRAVSLAEKGWNAMTTAEREEWIAGAKGAYDASDLNRVGQAMEYIMDHLNQYGYAVTVTPRTDWAIGEKPTPEDLQHYLDDVSTLRAVMELPSSTPDVPADMLGLTLEEANDIERILMTIEAVINAMTRVYIRAGMPWAMAGVRYYFAN